MAELRRAHHLHWILLHRGKVYLQLSTSCLPGHSLALQDVNLGL